MFIKVRRLCMAEGGDLHVSQFACKKFSNY